MIRGTAERFTNRRATRWTSLGSLVAVTTLIACGGRTATDDNSLLDDSSLVGAGEVLDVTNGASTIPGIGTNPAKPGGTATVGTGMGATSPPPSLPPPRPVPPRPTPPTPTPTGGPTTSNPTTSSTVEPTTTSDEPQTDDSTRSIDPTSSTTDPTSSTTATSTTVSPTTEPDPTTTDVTSEPPPPFDPLHPPDGLVPLGLSSEYANTEWFDTDKCSRNYDWAGSSHCYASHYCSEGGTSIECYDDGAGDWSCTCYGFDQYSHYLTVPGGAVPANDPRQACRIGSAICLTDAPPTQEPDCDDRESASLYYCSRDRSCNERYSSSYGEFVVSQPDANVNCSSDGYTPGVANCSCSGAGGYKSFALSSELSSACEAGIEVCTVGIDADSMQPMECIWNSSDFASTWCQQYYDCTQHGESNGVPVSVSGQVNVNCWLDENDVWGCSCGDGASVADVPNDLESLAVCEFAGQQCMQGLGNLFD
jgi:hypothetical protein